MNKRASWLKVFAVLLMVVFLFLMTYIPEIVMFIPNMMT